MSPSGNSLFIGTGGEEWSISSNAEGQPLTPTNVRAQRRGAYSSSHLPARMVQDSTLFLQRDARRLRQVIVNNASGEFSAADMTALAGHVSTSGIRQMAVAQSPQVVVWAVTNDGRLISMTFEKEQNVFAWALHETAGNVRSVAVLMGTSSDEVWLSVERGGRACLERMTPSTAEAVSANWRTLPYVDSAKLYIGSPRTTQTILPHLDGESLAGLADGVAFTADAAGSTVDLPFPASQVLIGLPYTAKLVPMHRDLPLQDGTARGRQLRISRMGVALSNSGSCRVADAETGTQEALPLSGTPLHTGYHETAVTSQSRQTLKPMVIDDSPYPLTVQSLTLKLDVYGEQPRATQPSPQHGLDHPRPAGRGPHSLC
jgi:hypothetical protein